MTRKDDALQVVEPRRTAPLSARLQRRVQELFGARTEPPPPPVTVIESPETEAELRALRSAVERIDGRLSHEWSEREAKLREELRRAMLRLETELSERFAASVLEHRRLQRRLLAAALLLLAGVAGLATALLVGR